ncbi:protein LYRIC-like [Struthio camelus]|uniref:protein LYRIC-like n=1 Tax=Struthio camelus TaxID=8801 RepID=UPI003603C1BF
MPVPVPVPALAERLAVLPARLLALPWPALLLGAAAAALLALRGLRRARAAPGPRRGRAGGQEAQQQQQEEEEEEEGAGAGGRGAAALPGRPPERHRRPAQVPVNGQLVTSASIREKKLLKPKRKKKAQCSEKGVSKDLLSVEKDRLQEEEGVWQTKISSREKRHLRKERLKQKEDPSRASRGNSVVEWEEKGTVWPRTASGAEDTSGRGKGSLVAKAECGTALKTSEESVPSWSEEDVFCNVGTWDIAEVKSRPVTFGTFSELSRELDNVKSKSSEDSPSRHCWKASAPFLTADDVWQGHDDPSAIDLDSDWKAPTEEWGNWTGDEEHQAGDEKEKDLPKGKEDIHFCLSGRESKTQRKRKKIEVKEARDRAGLMLSQEGWEARTKERPTELISTKHSSDTVGASFKIALDVANNTPNIDVPGKKERRKRKKMKKQT